jgi:hypothetical protein
VGVLGEVVGGGGVGAGDLGEHGLGELGLEGDVYGGEVDAGPGGAEGDAGGFGIEPEVELVAGMGCELGVGGLRGEAAAHDEDALGELGEVGVDGEGKGDVGERAGGEDGDLVGVGVDLADEEVGGVFVEGLGGGRALYLGGKIVWTVIGLGAGFGGQVPPGAVPGEGAGEGLLEVGFLLGAEEGEDGSGNDGDIGAVDELKHAEGVLDLFGLPGVAADHGDAEDLHLGGLEEDHHGHLVGAGGTRAVLVDEDEPLGDGGQGEEQKKKSKAGHEDKISSVSCRTGPLRAGRSLRDMYTALRGPTNGRTAKRYTARSAEVVAARVGRFCFSITRIDVCFFCR